MGEDAEYDGMLSCDEALACVLAKAWRVGGEKVALEDAGGRVLAEDAHADLDQPPFDKSAVDGYACCRVSCGDTLHVVGCIAAGDFPEREIQPGETVKIMTGAPMPPGADCVVMKEHVEVMEGDRIQIAAAHAGKRNFCKRGEDVRKGELVVRKGIRLAPQHLAILASIGLGRVQVARRVRVGVFSTGSELVSPEEQPGPGQIRNSNSVQLSSLARSAGAELIGYATVRDNMDALLKTVQDALSENDVVISTGGVSVGDYDLMPEIYSQLGMEIHLRRVAIQPGKPMVFGTTGEKAFFGLSGNPMSSFLQFTLFAAPFICALSGMHTLQRKVSAPLASEMHRGNTRRMQWFPVRFTENGKVEAVPFHGSAHIHALAEADGLGAYPLGVDTLRAGEQLDVLLLHGAA